MAKKMIQLVGIGAKIAINNEISSILKKSGKI